MLLDVCTDKIQQKSAIRSSDCTKFAAILREEIDPIEADSENLLILDIGCGLGDSTFALRRTFPNAQIIAIDPNPMAIRTVQEEASSKGFSRINFFSLDICDPEFGAKFFELTGKGNENIHLICSVYMVSQYQNTEKQIALSNILEMLTPKGRMYLLDFIWAETDKILMEINCHPDWREHVTQAHVQHPLQHERPRDREVSISWLRSLESIDFEVMQIVSNKLHYEFDSFDSLVQILENICPTLVYLTDEKVRTRYFLEFFRRTFNQLLLPIMKNRISYQSLIICARKRPLQPPLPPLELEPTIESSLSSLRTDPNNEDLLDL